jgi:hypothetical protein
MLDATDLDARNVDAMFDRIDELLADPRLPSSDGLSRPLCEFIDDRSSAPLADILTGARVPFRVAQQIAPLLGDRLPRLSDFFPVMCHDLSIGGVSFLLENRPDFKSVVFAIGNPPTVNYMEARVVHCTEVLVDASRLFKRLGNEDLAAGDSDGPAQPMVLVGCQFVRCVPADQIGDLVRDDG